MAIKLYECDCLYEELGNNILGTVKGYKLIFECDSCKIKRETDLIESTKQQRKQEIIAELNELDRKVIRPLLDDETERIDAIKAQKIILREELGTL